MKQYEHEQEQARESTRGKWARRTLQGGLVVSLAVLMVAGVTTGRAGHAAGGEAANFKPADPQVAAGEWSIEIQHPPCGSVHNLEVIWPKDGQQDAPIRIECNQMPVEVR